ncbi:MAG: hypothetical protein AB7D33_10840 [Sphingobium sp.]
MAALSWIICIATFLGGLAARSDFARPIAEPIAFGLLLASFLSCPLLWKMPPLSELLNGRQRMMACLALLLALPLILIPA